MKASLRIQVLTVVYIIDIKGQKKAILERIIRKYSIAVCNKTG